MKVSEKPDDPESRSGVAVFFSTTGGGGAEGAGGGAFAGGGVVAGGAGLENGGAGAAVLGGNGLDAAGAGPWTPCPPPFTSRRTSSMSRTYPIFASFTKPTSR